MTEKNSPRAAQPHAARAAESGTAETRSEPASKDRDRRGGMRALAGPLGRVARPALRRRGLAGGRIVAEWPEIVGATLAAASCPETLRPARGAEAGGVLVVRVDGPLAVELQHLEPVVIERINGYFGYRAIERLAIVRGPLPERPAPAGPAPEAPDPEAARKSATHAAGVTSEPLRAALESLGRAVLARSRGAAR